MSRINPLDHNPIIERDYLTGEPLEVARQLRERYYQENFYPQAIHNQDQNINPYMWSSNSCNRVKNNTDFKINEERENLFTPLFSFLRRTSNFRPFTTRDPVIREELGELPQGIVRHQNVSRQQRQSRFDRNRQIHK